MNRLFVILLLLAPLLGVGCTTNQARVDYRPADPEKPGSTFLLLGLWNVFSRGLDDVAANLNEDGYHAQSLSGPEWRNIGRQIIDLERAGGLRRPLILGGHSLGADKALYLSEMLGREGIEVDYVCLLDPTNPPKVPGNVKRCHNIYLSHAWTDWIPAFRGVPVKAESEQTELINFDVRHVQAGGLTEIDFNHFDIETDPEVQALMTSLLRAALEDNPDVASILPPSSRVRFD